LACKHSVTYPIAALLLHVSSYLFLICPEKESVMTEEASTSSKQFWVILSLIIGSGALLLAWIFSR